MIKESMNLKVSLQKLFSLRRKRKEEGIKRGKQSFIDMWMQSSVPIFANDSSRRKEDLKNHYFKK